MMNLFKIFRKKKTEIKNNIWEELLKYWDSEDAYGPWTDNKA